MSRNFLGFTTRRGWDQLRHPDFGYVIGRLVCARCENHELAHVRRYADNTLHLLTEDVGSAKLFAQAARADGQRRPVPWLDVDLDEIRPDASLPCRKHGPRALTAEAIRRVCDGTPTRPKTAHV
jgi:hypothetical protein